MKAGEQLRALVEQRGDGDVCNGGKLGFSMARARARRQRCSKARRERGGVVHALFMKPKGVRRTPPRERVAETDMVTA